jgi:hypothetical protein
VKLDVGCGSKPSGDINADFFSGGWNRQEGDQSKGEFLNPHLIPNFVVAHGNFLPFRENCFEVVYSCHTIEHVENPFKMLKELLRVSKRKVIIRCPHRKGSAAKRPFHINYLDEEWFRLSTAKLGYQAKILVTQYDYPLTSKMIKSPKSLKFLFGRNLFFRVIRKAEKKLLSNRFLNFPLEIEVQISKQDVDEVIFIIVYNDEQVLNNCFLSSVGINRNSLLTYHNKDKKGLPEIFNEILNDNLLKQNAWLVFCHQDFILNEPLKVKLINKNKLGVYGPIGCRLDTPPFLGQITQVDKSIIGTRLLQDTPVETLDEMCLIVHTQAFREGLRFDPRFTFHFYGADLCIQAFILGFDVMAIQIDCQHKCKTLTGDVNSPEYFEMLERFENKWSSMLPIKTPTRLVSN